MFDKLISNISEYINLKNVLKKENLKNILIKSMKDFISVDDAIVSFGNNTEIAGFKFHIVDREQVTMESDITDHYVDTNRPVQDHIAWKPVEITIHGFQGEYYNDISENIGHSASYYAVMSTVNSYIPKFDNISIIRKAKSAISRATSGNSIINKVTNQLTSAAYGVLLNMLKEFKNNFFGTYEEQYHIEFEQTKAFFFFEYLWESGVPVNVTTSWKHYENMVVKSIKPLRDRNADITDFTVVLKQINKTETIVTQTVNTSGNNSTNSTSNTQNNAKPKNNATRVKNSKAPTTNKGKTKGKSIPTMKNVAKAFFNLVTGRVGGL